jgi:acetoacetyl-CoA synthetase
MNASTHGARPTTWTPTADQVASARISGFAAWVLEHQGVPLNNYREVLSWSVNELSVFWDSIRQYFDVIGTGFTGEALAEERMPGAVWYPNARLNFAENILRFAKNPSLADTTAVLDVQEDDSTTTLTWSQLEAAVASVAARLRNLGVVPGDRVAAVLPNLPEAIIGLLATASIGAIWTINSPDLSAKATLDRLAQLAPKVLFAVDGYRFNGKEFDRLAHLAEVEAGLPSLEHTLLVRNLDGTAATGVMATGSAGEGSFRGDFAEAANFAAQPDYARVTFDHPLWVLFSSGTTGAPKGIVHGHGGMLLETLKSSGLNQNMGPGDVYYVAANTSWMVWNTLVTTLAVGAAVVTYAGSPTFGRKDRQLQVIANTGATRFATGAAYLQLLEKSGLTPAQDWDLSRLKSVMSTGSPLPDSTWLWFHENVSKEAQLGSDSGGTDICSGFIGSNPLEPVHLGELQGPQLGVAVEAWDENGKRVLDAVGDMVITRPLPSMPVSFWDDADGSKYHDSYFEKFAGVWTHGDWITETKQGAFVVHGRSDATLNRAGVRLGSADIYGSLRHVPEVLESLVIGVERPDGDYYMPLFVVLEDDSELTDELKERITATIREHTSARHVPDAIIRAPAVPLTHALKKIEVPVKKLFAGHNAATAVNRGSLTNPDTVDWYVEQAEAFLTSSNMPKK